MKIYTFPEIKRLLFGTENPKFSNEDHLHWKDPPYNIEMYKALSFVKSETSLEGLTLIEFCALRRNLNSCMEEYLEQERLGVDDSINPYAEATVMFLKEYYDIEACDKERSYELVQAFDKVWKSIPKKGKKHDKKKYSQLHAKYNVLVQKETMLRKEYFKRKQKDYHLL